MTIRRLLPLAALLLAAGLVLGQGAPKKDVPTPKPAPGSLEDTLEKALRNSADIKAAEAKVRNAEAELNRVRHQVLTKATVAARANPVATALVRRAAALARGDHDEGASLAATLDDLGAHYQRDRSRELAS